MQRVCRFWSELGRCRKGEQCDFVHVQGDRKQFHRALIANNARLQPTYFRTKVCSFWQNGFCNYGDRCTYLHPPGVPQLNRQDVDRMIQAQQAQQSSQYQLPDADIPQHQIEARGICNYWAKGLYCRYAEHCKFRHDTGNIPLMDVQQQQQQQQQQQMPQMHQGQSTSMYAPMGHQQQQQLQQQGYSQHQGHGQQYQQQYASYAPQQQQQMGVQAHQGHPGAPVQHPEFSRSPSVQSSASTDVSSEAQSQNSGGSASVAGSGWASRQSSDVSVDGQPEDDIDQKLPIVQLALGADDDDKEAEHLYGSGSGREGHSNGGSQGEEGKSTASQSPQHGPAGNGKNKHQLPLFGASPLGFPSALSSPAFTSFGSNGDRKTSATPNGQGQAGSKSTSPVTLPAAAVTVHANGAGKAAKGVSGSAAAAKKEGSPPSALFLPKDYMPDAECQKCHAMGTVYNKDLVRWCWKCCPCVFCNTGAAVCAAGVCAKCYSPVLGEKLR